MKHYSIATDNVGADSVPDAYMRSIRDALDILGGKWKLPILLCLRHGNKRFKELKQLLPGITSKMLSQALKELEQNKIITRLTDPEDPVIVEYQVTLYCKSLEKIVEGLKEWGDHHRALLFNRLEPEQKWAV